MGLNLARDLPIFLVVVLSLTVHEYFHAWAAFRLGDDTAKRMGRLTLNPIAHIDFIGTILLPLFLALVGQPALGWAKPVPFDPTKFRRGISMSLGDVLVSIAGPLSNLGLALVATTLLGVLRPIAPELVTADSPLAGLLVGFIVVNVGLALFNLIPVPPLDGSRVVGGLLPRGMREVWGRLLAFGPILLLGLMYLRNAHGQSYLTVLLGPPRNFLVDFLIRISRGYVS